MSNVDVTSPRRFRLTRMKRHQVCLCVTAVTVFIVILNKQSIYVAPEDKLKKVRNGTSLSDLSLSSRPKKSQPASPPSKQSVTVGETPRSSPKATPHSTTWPKPSSKIDLPTSKKSSHPPSLSPTTSKDSVGSKPQSSPFPSPAIGKQPSTPASSRPNGALTKPTSRRHDNNNMTQMELDFIQQWCDLKNGHVQWYPTGENEWQQRAPYVIIPGEKHAGTTFLYQALLDHPNFLSATNAEELDYFLPRNFNNNLNSAGSKNRGGDGSDTSSTAAVRTTNVFLARQHMYVLHYKTKPLKKSSSKISIDATAGYLFYTSKRVPEHVLCVTPWSQLIFVLGDPVNRVYSQWAHARKLLRLTQSFEDWIAPELQLMESVGLVATTTETSTSSLTAEASGKQQHFPLSVEEEDEAWARYQNGLGVSSNFGSATHGAIGRSMYVIPIRHWFEAYKQSGKSLPQYIHVLRAEDLAANFQKEYDQILQFLNLSPHELRSTETNSIPTDLFAKKFQSTERYSQPPMKAETRQMLQNFFAPYNERLYQLLQEELGGASPSSWTADKHWR